MPAKKKPSDAAPKLKHCKVCDGLVAPDAKTCVHCGTLSPLGKDEKDSSDDAEHAKIAKILWIFIGILFFITFLGVLLFPGCRG